MRFDALFARGAVVAALAAIAAVAAAAPAATPTPTPRPRLSGGFGRTAVPGAPAPDGQSMSDVVRAAGAARAHKDQKPVAITNDSLVKDPNKGRLSTLKARPSPAPAASSGATGATGPVAGSVPPAGAPSPARPAGAISTTTPTPAPAAAPVEDETVWRERAHSARRRVEELKAEIAQLESDSKQLENDFYRWDDGQYRDRVIKPAWDKKREDLETRRRELVDAEAELADLPERARKAGALPGWLRE